MRLTPPPATQRRSTTTPRPQIIGRPATPGRIVDALLAERRHRASVAPQDHALYVCGCGTGFSAAVTTTVTCPSCGAGQDW